MKNQNNYAFIDLNNLYRGLRDLGWTIDYVRFRRYLLEKHGVTHVYAFIGYMEGNESLYRSLQEKDYILIFKPTFEDQDGNVKGNCDAELVLQAMIEYPNYDQAVLITGDGDFACLATYLNDHDKLRRVLVPNDHKYSSLLKKAVVEKIDGINRMRGKVQLNIKKKKEEVVL